MGAPLHDDAERLSITDDDAQSFIDEDDVRELRIRHWLSETASTRLMQNSALTRADSPLLGFDHLSMPERDCKPLPNLPAPVSRLRSQSNASFTMALGPAPAGPFHHRPSASQSRNSVHSHSPASSRRPSLAQKPSVALLTVAETAPLLQGPPPRQSTRLHSIASSLSLGSNRNAVYIDSEEVSIRLDNWLISGKPEVEHSDVEDQDFGECYTTTFDKQSTIASIPTPTQGPPPNTPMTSYTKTPFASSSQIYLGKPVASGPPTDEVQDQTLTEASITVDQEDVRATPVPHGKLVPLAISCSPPSSESAQSSPLLSAVTPSTPPTSAGISSVSIEPTQSPPESLSSKPSLGSLSVGMVSIGLAYQNHASNPNLLSPPLATASRWSLSSSIAGDTEKDKKKGGKRRRLVSFISKLAGNGANKEAKESSDVPILKPVEIQPRERSSPDAPLRESSLLPPVRLKSGSKPPSLKLGTSSHSMGNLRSPTLASKPSLSSLGTPFSPTQSSMLSSTPTTATFPSPTIGSPVSATFAPNSPINKSFTSTRLSVSTSMTTTSTNTASPLMPNTPILNDVPLASPGLKSAISVPALSPAWEGPALIRRDNSFGMSMNNAYFGEGTPSPTTALENDGDDLDGDAEYYVRGFPAAPKDDLDEAERKARLSLITDMLDRDLNSSTTAPAPQPNDETCPPPEPPRRDSLVHKAKGTVKIDVAEKPCQSTRTSPTHCRNSSSVSRTSSPVQSRKSASGSHPISPTVSTPPPLSSKGGLRSFAARMGISNSNSTPQSPPSPGTESKRKSLVSLVSNGKRSKRRLVISGVGDGQGEVAALKEWCSSLGEVRSMMKVKSVEGVVTRIGQNGGRDQNVWVVDFKKSSVAESVCRLQAKVEIKGAGSVCLSWETTKPKLKFNVGKMGWMP